MSRGRTHTSALTRCKAASQSSRRRKTSRRVLKPCKGAQNNVLGFWYSESSFVLCSAVLTTRSVGYTGLRISSVCSPGLLEEFFSETQFPVWLILGNPVAGSGLLEPR